MTKSSDARQNLIGGFRPHKALGLRIGVGHVRPDGSFERLRAAMPPPTPQLLLRQQREPAFHEIEPGGAGRLEVHMEARSLEQPPSNHSDRRTVLVVEDDTRPSESEHSPQLCQGIGEIPEWTGAVAQPLDPSSWGNGRKIAMARNSGVESVS